MTTGAKSDVNPSFFLASELPELVLRISAHNAHTKNRFYKEALDRRELLPASGRVDHFVGDEEGASAEHQKKSLIESCIHPSYEFPPFARGVCSCATKDVRRVFQRIYDCIQWAALRAKADVGKGTAGDREAAAHKQKQLRAIEPALPILFHLWRRLLRGEACPYVAFAGLHDGMLLGSIRPLIAGMPGLPLDNEGGAGGLALGAVARGAVGGSGILLNIFSGRLRPISGGWRAAPRPSHLTDVCPDCQCRHT